MIFALDSNALSYFMRGEGRGAARLQALPPHQVALPAIVIYEINCGLRRARRKASRVGAGHAQQKRVHAYARSRRRRLVLSDHAVATRGSSKATLPALGDTGFEAGFASVKPHLQITCDPVFGLIAQ